jgi:hypothetical protein
MASAIMSAQRLLGSLRKICDFVVAKGFDRGLAEQVELRRCSLCGKRVHTRELLLYEAGKQINALTVEAQTVFVFRSIWYVGLAATSLRLLGIGKTGRIQSRG